MTVSLAEILAPWRIRRDRSERSDSEIRAKYHPETVFGDSIAPKHRQNPATGPGTTAWLLLAFGDVFAIDTCRHDIVADRMVFTPFLLWPVQMSFTMKNSRRSRQYCKYSPKYRSESVFGSSIAPGRPTDPATGSGTRA